MTRLVLITIDEMRPGDLYVMEFTTGEKIVAQFVRLHAGVVSYIPKRRSLLPSGRDLCITPAKLIKGGASRRERTV